MSFLYEINGLEKWARCFRHFEHGDTDTNMFLERYKIPLLYITHNYTYAVFMLN